MLSDVDLRKARLYRQVSGVEAFGNNFSLQELLFAYTENQRIDGWPLSVMSWHNYTTERLNGNGINMDSGWSWENETFTALFKKINSKLGWKNTAKSKFEDDYKFVNNTQGRGDACEFGRKIWSAILGAEGKMIIVKKGGVRKV